MLILTRRSHPRERGDVRSGLASAGNASDGAMRQFTRCDASLHGLLAQEVQCSLLERSLALVLYVVFWPSLARCISFCSDFQACLACTKRLLTRQLGALAYALICSCFSLSSIGNLAYLRGVSSIVGFA